MCQLTNAFEEADDRARVWPMVRELFTRTEKIMFAKRLTLIYLLSCNTPFETITKTLRISPTTVSKFSLALDKGKHKNTLAILGRKGKLLDIMEKLLRAGLPPQGRGRWKKIYRLTDK